MVSFFCKRLNEVSTLVGTSVNLFFEDGGPKWTRFAAAKPRRLKQSTGLFLRAGFQVHFGSLGLTLFSPSSPFWLAPSQQFSVLMHSVLFQPAERWWAKMDSNHRPHDYQSCALASWAIGPSWWRLAGSNRWPPACKAGALPAELNPQIFSHLRLLGTFLAAPSKLNNVKF